MPEISREEVAHLATLARIDLDDAELDHLAPQLSVILESVASINGVAGDDVPPTSHALPLTNVFRDDVVTPGLTAEQALSGAPAVDQQRFSRAADPGGRAVSAIDIRSTAAEMAQALADGTVTSVELTRAAPRPDRGRRRRRPRLPARRPRGRARPGGRLRRPPRGRPDAEPAGRRTDRGQGRPHHRGPAHDVRLEDPRGLDPALRLDRRGEAPGSRPADPGQDQHGRVRDGLLHRALGLRTHPQPLGPRPDPRWLGRWFGRGRRVPSRRRSPSAPTPAARSASPARSPARSA